MLSHERRSGKMGRYRNNYRLMIMIPIHATNHNQIQLNTLKFSRVKILNKALDNFRLLLDDGWMKSCKLNLLLKKKESQTAKKARKIHPTPIFTSSHDTRANSHTFSCFFLGWVLLVINCEWRKVPREKAIHTFYIHSA